MTLRHASSDDAHAHTGEVRDAKPDVLESLLECASKGRGVACIRALCREAFCTAGEFCKDVCLRGQRVLFRRQSGGNTLLMLLKSMKGRPACFC